jgi:hypothetical protein
MYVGISGNEGKKLASDVHSERVSISSASCMSLA